LEVVRKAQKELERQIVKHKAPLSLVPDETTKQYHSFVNRGPIYGMESWADYFTPRQLLALTTLARLVRKVGENLDSKQNNDLSTAIQTCLAMAVDRQVDSNSSLCSWRSVSEDIGHTFGRQALPMIWDFVEGNILSGSTRDWLNAVEGGLKAIESLDPDIREGHAEQASAITHPLPNNSANAFITDPPYYYSVQYSDLSDFFYIWLRRTLSNKHEGLFKWQLTPKDDEIIVQSPGHEFAVEGKNKAFYESRMKIALAEGNRILSQTGIGVVVFAHSSTAGWEALLQAMADAGWIITGSWPIDTEMATRVIAKGRSVLASSIHLVCRPREKAHEAGDWRDVLQELPKRIHEWMPRLSSEGVVGADAIFSCLGPALELFSRYSRVEKASGEHVLLKEYLEYVWAAVAKEALNMIFEGADATGFEEDSRLTAMWLWTLCAGNNGNGKSKSDENEEEVVEEGESGKFKKTLNGYILEYDAARKIAQGLGAHLERLKTIVEIKGEIACLLPVSERTRYLFGKEESQAPSAKRKKKDPQLKLGFMQEIETIEDEGGWGEKSSPKAGSTTLDRLHQSMILFAAGRSEAMKRFLVEEGVGNDQRFWRLAQALSALYPKTSDEKRWVDGVLAREKGLGF
jgi:adenine-specific DNA methylase